MNTYCSNCGELLRAGASCKCGGGGGVSASPSAQVDCRSEDISNRFLTSGLNQGIETGIKRMLGMEDSGQPCDCVSCHKQLRGDGDIYVPENTNDPHCLGCYTTKFSHGNCKKCGLPVLGLGKPWVRDRYNDLYHQPCFDPEEVVTTVTTSTEKRTVRQINHNPQDIQRLNENNAAALKRQEELEAIRRGMGNSDDKKCGYCGLACLEGGIVTGKGTAFHSACFRCSGCDGNFDGQTRYVEKDGLVFHSNCATGTGSGGASSSNKGGNGNGCTFCGQAVTSGSYLEWKGNKAHAGCFKCSDCTAPLAQAPHGEFQDKPYCAGCLSKHMPPVSQTRVFSKTPGFTVDPVTGKKVPRMLGGARVGGQVQVNVKPGSGCPRCGKTVYSAEKELGPEAVPYHRACLNCKECRTSLTQATFVVGGNDIYCKNCHSKLFSSARKN